ncbi:TPA: hypothetical protein SH331_004466 [Pseudomonas aeruginosa]|uniref:hypothetical protein n=1 Tax=Pseudomonas aeruginosa TaxID=287 RepID=UPI000F52056D|nr:hypothetical protein [Pseudomonas aeruginosa]QYA83136.1 hypothetical protein KXE03_13540 [Pseudomonas aeruginosa]RQC89751.1 hypothetical protein IPC345_24675 [Pseudomonas aeruginosa]HBN9929489.1 hypothetical protein [Pseudomonas aeruginosa]HCI2778139.1 hypothetical protein [Pseudomonas aeruginosa]HCR1391377.1 hypothetical protein [Pseudomonas aeruginosa]
MDNQSTSTHSMAFWEKLEFLDNTWPTDEERSFSGDLYVDGKIGMKVILRLFIIPSGWHDKAH